jgi:hypothetical protein
MVCCSFTAIVLKIMNAVMLFSAVNVAAHLAIAYTSWHY